MLMKLLVLGAGLACCAVGGTLTYIGDAAAFGSALFPGSGARADLLSPLSYIFSNDVAGVFYTVPSTGQIQIDTVNLLAQTAGSVTPFVAIYNSGSKSNAADYTLLSVGDTLAIPTGSTSGVLVNDQFTVGGVNPIVNVTAGEILVAGFFQTNTTVVFENTAQSATNDRIWQTNIVNGVSPGGTLTGGADGFNFNLTYGFDIGFQQSAAAPEPAGLSIVGLGLLSLMIWRRRLERFIWRRFGR